MLGLVVPMQERDRFAFCVVNVGDSYAYIYNKKVGVKEVTQGSHPIDEIRDMRYSGGALGPADGYNPDLGNLTCSFIVVEKGDLVFLCSDGISDNFDPAVAKFTPRFKADEQTRINANIRKNSEDLLAQKMNKFDNDNTDIALVNEEIVSNNHGSIEDSKSTESGRVSETSSHGSFVICDDKALLESGYMPDDLSHSDVTDCTSNHKELDEHNKPAAETVNMKNSEINCESSSGTSRVPKIDINVMGDGGSETATNGVTIISNESHICDDNYEKEFLSSGEHSLSSSPLDIRLSVNTNQRTVYSSHESLTVQNHNSFVDVIGHSSNEEDDTNSGEEFDVTDRKNC